MDTNSINFSDLRLPANYGVSLQVKQKIVSVMVGKPGKTTFFRTHPDEKMTFSGFLLETKLPQQEHYLVTPEMVPTVREYVRPTRLYAVIDRSNVVSLVPVALPEEDGSRHSAHEERELAVENGKQAWTKMVWDKSTLTYIVHEAAGVLPEPIWPEETMDQLMAIAFKNKVISNDTHPVVQTLLGAI